MFTEEADENADRDVSRIRVGPFRDFLISWSRKLCWSMDILARCELGHPLGKKKQVQGSHER